MPDVRLMTFDPGHFHAALIQKEMVPGVAPTVHVYADLGPDLLAHLNRISGFNRRALDPTRWQLEVHAGSDPLSRMLAEKPGNVVVFSGRNRGKIDAILASLEAGLHVLADKPWVIAVEDLPKLQRALELAQKNRLIALDIMTERYEVTNALQRELIHDPAVFGAIEPGSQDRPGVFLESEHFLSKMVAGVALRRPSWWFDIAQTGEGLADVGTHLVDLVAWTLFPEQSVALEDIRILRGGRSPTNLSKKEFSRVTGEADFPAFLADKVVSSNLLFYCNNSLSYILRGVHVWLNVAWGVDAGPGKGDRHLSRFRGSRSYIEVRQGMAEDFRPEVYVVPRESPDVPGVESALNRRVGLLQEKFPGLNYVQLGEKFRLEIPEKLRVGHEAHFAEVFRSFLHYLDNAETLPAWEQPNMLAKYHITTNGVRLAQA
jgi:predicted dehydrogenase